jgi:hypothetical protein
VRKFQRERNNEPTSTSENEEARIALRNSRETGDLGGTACHRMDRQL